jgi:hypothetical protein
MRNNGMKRIYIGDVGEIPAPYGYTQISPDLDIDSLTTREMFSLLLEAGVPLQKIIGIDNCYEHTNMVWLGANSLPSEMNLLEDVVYCRNCFQQYRRKHK